MQLVNLLMKGALAALSIPIVFIHAGDDDYLYYSLIQAKMSNPSSNVFLLGDCANRKYESEFVHHFMMEDFFTGAFEFAGVYRHESPNTYEYELFCFQRWFVLRDFMRALGIERCCYLDSDIMLYEDIDDPVYHSFTNVWTMLSFNTMRTLEDFCNLVSDYYRDPHLFAQLQAFAADEQFPGISDMVLSRLYIVHYPEFGGHLEGVFGDSFFDGNLRHPMWFPPYAEEDEAEMLDGNKKVYRMQGKLYARLASGKFVQLLGQHFQGDNKTYMRYFLKSQSEADSDGQLMYFDYRSREWIAAPI